jgi:hypothetical protein
MADGDKAEPLPALLFAGAYITGGIVGYDSNVVTGGVGARILGIGAHKEYRQDIVSIILRLINVKSGEVIITITMEKTIFSTSIGSDVFKYVDAGVMLLEIEAGIAKNEPVTFAVRKAIEAGVVELIKQGIEKDLWKYKEIIEPTLEVTEEDLEVIEEVKDEKVNLHERIVWEDEATSTEKTYTEYLIEKDAGIHDNETSTNKKTILEELEELLEEENADEKDDEIGATPMPINIHS